MIENQNEIYYLKFVKGKWIAVTEKGSISYSMNIEELLMHLNEKFMVSHPNCIVNTEQVMEYNFLGRYFRLKNGEKVPCLVKKYQIPNLL